jgi:hypothetical protein
MQQSQVNFFFISRFRGAIQLSQQPPDANATCQTIAFYSTFVGKLYANDNIVGDVRHGYQEELTEVALL